MTLSDLDIRERLARIDQLTADTACPSLAELIAQIERQQEETRKFVSEQHKLHAQANKLAEANELASERCELDRDRGLAPWQASAITEGNQMV